MHPLLAYTLHHIPHLTCSGLYQCFMLDYAQKCRTSTLIMVPINFWRNFDPFKIKKIFLAQKLTDRKCFNLSKLEIESHMVKKCMRHCTWAYMEKRRHLYAKTTNNHYTYLGRTLDWLEQAK